MRTKTLAVALVPPRHLWTRAFCLQKGLGASAGAFGQGTVPPPSPPEMFMRLLPAPGQAAKGGKEKCPTQQGNYHGKYFKLRSTTQTPVETHNHTIT